MLSDHLKQLEATKAKLIALEQSYEAELTKELASLPTKYGFDTTAAFIKAVKVATGGRSGRKTGRQTGPGKKRRTRAVVTEDTRAGVRKLVESGKTGAEIAKSLGISLPTVQNIKKALGLVRKR